MVCVWCRVKEARPGKPHPHAETLMKAINIGYGYEEEWAEHPVEVDEFRCNRCKQYNHWWFYPIRTVGSLRKVRNPYPSIQMVPR
jgi:hypothetical protein